MLGGICRRPFYFRAFFIVDEFAPFRLNILSSCIQQLNSVQHAITEQWSVTGVVGNYCIFLMVILFCWMFKTKLRRDWYYSVFAVYLGQLHFLRIYLGTMYSISSSSVSVSHVDELWSLPDQVVFCESLGNPVLLVTFLRHTIHHGSLFSVVLQPPDQEFVQVTRVAGCH